MKEFTITASESGQKCIKYCEKVLPAAGTGFLHKMLRKKNITLNGKKSDGTERLCVGDVVRFFFADETFDTFSRSPAGPKSSVNGQNKSHSATCEVRPLDENRIIYEDEHVLFYNKPVGILSQKASPEDISLNEMLLAYLTDKNKHEKDTVSKASICNRLDRNTSGLVICGKTYMGLRTMNELIAQRTVGKYYHCIVTGQVRQSVSIRGYLKKDEKTNKVTISKSPFEGSSYIETEIRPIVCGRDASLLEVHLITGKTHQIRSHLASLGHAIIGDYKYGNRQTNDRYRKKYGLKSQLLHAYRIVFPKMEAEFSFLSEKEFIAPKPDLFTRIEKEEIHGNVEFQRS
ncbi:MAG: RluA family pseudouridine synthase [Lachnospiraceae bacterium]|nr:RluA family pseudouridine synthase [Lachnospiraceae bacterium]